MSESVTDELLERVYRPFARQHDKHRHNLLQKIAALDSPPQVETPRKRRRYAQLALSVAALLLVSATWVLIFWSPSTPHASAVENARQQLLNVRSLHLKGWIFQTVERDGQLVVEQFPTESYAERPSWYWSNGYGFSFEGNHKLTSVTHSYSASDGEKTIWVSHDQRLAMIEPANRLQTVLRTESTLQQNVFDRLVVGLPDAYQYLGTEELDGMACDVYEHREAPQGAFGQRYRLWLNARSGVPVRMKGWASFQADGEEPSYEYHTIRINGPRPENLFSFEAPEGYQVNVAGEPPPLALPEGATASGNGLSLGTWIPFSIEDRALLFCWWVDPSIDEKGLQRMPEFSLGPPGEDRPCRYILLRTDPPWNWALLLPEDDVQIAPDDRLLVVLKGDRARLQSDSRPLRLPKDQLLQIVLEAQKSTLPPDTTIEPFTLDEITDLLQHAGTQ